MGPLAWSSDEYIGRGGRQLPFALTDGVGSSHIVNKNVYAEVIHVDPDNRIITSTFRIMASSSSLVTCAATAYTHNNSYHIHKNSR